MNESVITLRYANALFSVAKEKNLLSVLKNDMELILDVYKNSVELNQLLKSPVVEISEKLDFFKEKINILSLNFLRLVINNQREALIPDMCRYFLKLVKQEWNIKWVIITTAVDVNEATIKKVKNKLESELESEVELIKRVNSNIIGGMILRIGDKQYDASIATQLKEIKQEMMKN